MGPNPPVLPRRVPELKIFEGVTLSVQGIEVTQAIQDMDNTVTLVADKTTIVRVYVDANPIFPMPFTGELAWRRGDSAEAYLPAFNQVDTQFHNPPTPIQKRHDVNASLNFRLPVEAIISGSLTLRVNRLYIPGTEDLAFGGKTQVTVELRRMPPPPIRVIGLSYKVPGSGNFVSPNAIDFLYFRSYLERAFPVARVEWSQAVIEAEPDITPPFDSEVDGVTERTAEKANAQLAVIQGLDASEGFDPRTHYVGLVSDNGGRDFMRGRAFRVADQPQPNTPASSPAGVGGFRFPWDTDASYADWYATHELSHTLGCLHPGFPPDQPDDDPEFPYPQGQISDGDRYVGFDVGDANLNLPMQALPGQIYHDVMTYGDNLWLSAYTYEKILQRLLDEEALFSIDPFSIDEKPPLVEEGTREFPIDDANLVDDGSEGANRIKARLTRGQFVHVVAVVNFDAGTGEIRYVNPAKVATERAVSNEFGVELQFKDADGQLLSSHQPQVLLDSEDRTNAHAGLVSHNAPFVQGMKEVLLLINGQVKSRYTAGDIRLPAMPEIMLVDAEPGKPHRRRLTGAQDAQRSGITYTVQARPAGEVSWQTISAGRSVPDSEINVNQFPGAQKIEVRILMTNGFEELIIAEREIVVGNLGE